jgi:hypothetical protein
MEQGRMYRMKANHVAGSRTPLAVAAIALAPPVTRAGSRREHRNRVARRGWAAVTLLGAVLIAVGATGLVAAGGGEGRSDRQEVVGAPALSGSNREAASIVASLPTPFAKQPDVAPSEVERGGAGCAAAALGAGAQAGYECRPLSGAGD